MNETRVFADGYRGVFQKQEDFLECLKSIGRNSFWERRNSKNLRLVAITSGSKVEEELKEKYADEGLDEDIITDTIINTGLLLKVRNQYYPVRSCAIKSILDRAGISGAGLRRVEKSVYARILNDCLKAAKGEALLRISEGKVSAVLGGDCHDYAVLDMEQVFLHSVDYLTKNFRGCSYLAGFYEHGIRVLGAFRGGRTAGCLQKGAGAAWEDCGGDETCCQDHDLGYRFRRGEYLPHAGIRKREHHHQFGQSSAARTP